MTLKHQELIRMGEKELTSQAIELKQELAKERATVASGTKSEKPGKIRKLRREIARILTVMNAKKIKEARK
ncbi:MAG: 50S ribosomal protein L29 [archaeon]